MYYLLLLEFQFSLFDWSFYEAKYILPKCIANCADRVYGGKTAMTLPIIPICLNTSENDLDNDFFLPCLKWAKRYDRGVGYFTSGWITKNAAGLAEFANNSGSARWITSPILDERDYSVICSATTMIEVEEYFQSVLKTSIDNLVREIENNTLNALGWMIFDNILEFRFAIPAEKLNQGDFHDKFGVFYGDDGQCISFTGSVNDSAKGFSNYESIKVFKSWESMQPYIDSDIRRFEKLWNNKDVNLRVVNTDDVIREKLISLRTGDRPYMEKEKIESGIWSHQDAAIQAFLKNKNGILEMATGTGKTRTALSIISKLFEEGKIKRVVITTHGNDLLSQWVKEVLSVIDKNIQVYKYFDSIYKELSSFLLCRNKCVLIVSLEAVRLSESIDRITSRDLNAHSETLLVFDEVHRLGSDSLCTALAGKISPFQYRLGLSATPEREYDDVGNEFILQEVGPVIYEFTLEDAIRKGILCEFSYYPLEYELTNEEKQKKRAIIARYAAMKKRGEPVSDEEKYRDLAMVNKTSISKLPLFSDIIRENPAIIERCIIFVETREYGILVQNILIDLLPEYHTYYGEDDKYNLRDFGMGFLNCLITCKKISEGVDIKSVKNIILFSSDRGRLVTTQRIGRSLRTNSSDPEKRANVVDFICVNLDSENINGQPSADSDRENWLTELSLVRRNSDETI